MDKTSEIYKNVKSEADKIFKSKTGIYKSAWIVREYKNRGGIFIEKKPSKRTDRNMFQIFLFRLVF